VGILNFRHAVLTAGVKCRGGNDEDSGVDEECEHERDGGIERGKLDRFCFASGVLFVDPRLHDRGVKIKIMRHDGGTQNSDGDVKRVTIAHNLGVWKKSAGKIDNLRLRENRSEEHTSELQSQSNLVCRLLLEKKK